MANRVPTQCFQQCATGECAVTWQQLSHVSVRFVWWRRVPVQLTSARGALSDGIRPEWEDPANGHGGKWVMSFTRAQKATLDRLWLYLILAVIGEQFRDSDEICGCVVSIRAQACRIAMWVRSSDKNAYMSIGNQIKTILGLPPKKLESTTHANAMKKSSSKSSASAVI